MFSDVFGFFISIMAVWLGKKPSTQKLGFGYKRAEVLGALISIIIIWILTLYLIVQATIRIIL